MMTKQMSSQDIVDHKPIYTLKAIRCSTKTLNHRTIPPKLQFKASKISQPHKFLGNRIKLRSKEIETRTSKKSRCTIGLK